MAVPGQRADQANPGMLRLEAGGRRRRNIGGARRNGQWSIRRRGGQCGGAEPKSSFDAVRTFTSSLRIETSFRGAPTELGFTRVRRYHCPSRQQPTWMARSRNLEIPGLVLRTIHDVLLHIGE